MELQGAQDLREGIAYADSTMCRGTYGVSFTLSRAAAQGGYISSS
ncbi:hypothetical protein [Sodalis sp.]